jgi:hypothetical protein
VLEGRAALTDVDDLDELVRVAEALRRPSGVPPEWSWGDAARATWEVYADALASRSGAGRERRALL